MKRNVYVGAIFLALLVALGVGSTLLQKRAAVEAAAVQAPMFEVDPLSVAEAVAEPLAHRNDHRRVR
jgi:hypothetical protein